MKQTQFEYLHAQTWQALELALKQQSVELPQLYRDVCHQFSTAKQRRYSQSLIRYLNELTSDAHQVLYRQSQQKGQLLYFVAVGFPLALRRQKTYVLSAALLFFIPLAAMFIACALNEEMIYRLMNYDAVAEFQNMYDPSERAKRNREVDDDILMFGYYIKNNIGIAFQSFAGGAAWGAGTVFFLIYNGLMIGGVAGFMLKAGHAHTFFPFIVGHSAFELTAIIFSGAAGLMLGKALIAPGRLSRTEAFKIAGKQAIAIVYGAALMLVLAAMLEAFWSSSEWLTSPIKYGAGCFLWLLVVFYCLFAGRGLPRES